MPDLHPSLTGALSEARARVRVGYPLWLRPWLARDVIAITLGRTIYLRQDAAERALERLEPLVRHELAHVQQINRIGLPRFVVRYVAEFLANLWRERSVNRAYAMISFEVEAVEAERDEKRNGL